jgi:hypothetical protein
VVTDTRPGTVGVSRSVPEDPPGPVPLGLRRGLVRAALLGAALLAVLVPLVATVDGVFPGRAVLATLFMIAVPGVPIALALRLPSALLTAALAVATSFCVDIIMATIGIYSGWWHPVGAAWITAAIGLAVTPLAWWRYTAARRWTRPSVADLLPPDRLIGLSGLVVAAALWWSETRRIPLDDSGALGLLPELSWRYILALVVLSAVVASALVHRTVDHVVLLLAAALLALIAFATVGVTDGHGSVPVGWVHVGFIEYITDNGDVPASFDARFSWPGFFAAAAELVTLGGLEDASGLLVLASPVYNVLAIPALLVIARFVTRSWRWSWVAVFIYLLANWYQQDYFSPQATALVSYLSVIATLLWLLDGAGVPRLAGGLGSRIRQAVTRLPGLPPWVSPRTAAALGLLLAFLIAGIAVGHQLTPINLIFCLVGFAVCGLIRYRMLWLIAGLALAGWFSYGATDFWLGHLRGIVSEVGAVGNALDSSVSGRLSGNPTYQQAQYVRIAWSALLFLVAGVGAVILRRRREALLLAGLACAPFGLLAVQSYGGEVIIRCFLYATPVLAALAAVSIRSAVRAVRRVGARRGALTHPSAPTTRSHVLWALVSVPVLVLASLVLTFTRGLNVAFERTPPAQVAVSLEMYQRAEPGDTIALGYGTGLSPSLDITEFGVQWFTPLMCEGQPAVVCLGDPLPRFVIVSITQQQYANLSEGLPEGEIWRLAEDLVASGAYERVVSTPDAWLLERRTEVAPA